MRQAFHLPAAHRRRVCTLVAASGLLAALATPGAAMQCSRGQFLWKSKQKCIDRAEAAKLGIYHGPIPKQDKPQTAPGDTAKGKPEPVQPTAETIPAPAPEAAAAPQPPAAPEPAATAPIPIQPTVPPSPYGALPTDSFDTMK